METNAADSLRASHEKALRLVRILELLRLKPWTAQQLAAALGVKKRAVLYYLEDLRGLEPHLGFRLLHDEIRHTYALSSGVVLSDIEKVVAHTALRMLYHHSPGHNQQYLEAMLKLARGLPEPARTIAQKSAEAMAAREPGLEGGNLEKIANAWFRRQLIRFEYQLPERRDPVSFELETYFIEVSRANMAVYVIGRERSYKNELRTFKLARMRFVTLIGPTEAYEIPEGFDPKEYLSDAWGVVGSGGRPVRVRLRFSPQAVQRIREGGYPNLRELEEGDDGSLVVELRVGADEEGFPLELLSWIQGWGPRVEVLEPEVLRQRWLEEARAVVERYASSRPHYWAHTHPDPSRWQPLREHLGRVAELAAARARAFGEAEKGWLAGRLHDVGKYGDLFQRRLEGKERGLDHWSAGAHLALFEYCAPQVALAIQGHHIGLQSGAKESLKEMRLREDGRGFPGELRLSEARLELLRERWQADGLELPPPRQAQIALPQNAAAMLETRMLFSALVDADFLDTEAHLRGPEARPTPPPLQAARALERLEARLQELAQDQGLPSAIRRLRQQVSEACARAAQQDARLFTLTAPTGSGKTLAMLRFALRRAVQDPRIRRIVVVLPYLSILDQTVRIYRELFADFGPHYILEDHSLAYRPLRKDSSDEQDLQERERRLLSENWEAPIVLTTHVQLLESLHASRPGACRKLHNLAGSVLLFDEVQTLPTHLAVPTLKTLSHLASDKYGAVVVFATATQPAFDSLHSKVQENEPQGWQPREIVPDPAALFGQSRRVAVEWRLKNPTPNPALATLLEADPQALVVLNLKRQAHRLFRLAQERGLEGLYHLSTALCPAHRKRALEEIQARLEAAQPCRLIATQVVEAGVELDFPVGYRALGPLEAIAQTAGRVNRHGLRPEGRLVVFWPEDEGYPDRAYAQAAGLTRALQAEGGLELTPEAFRRYYHSLYGLQSVSDPEIEGLIKTQNYAELARRYRIIETSAVNVVVPYDDEARALMQEARERGIAADWIHRARPYAVPYFLPKGGPPPFLETVFLRYGRAEAPDWYLCPDPALYDASLGFIPEEGSGVGLVI
ncbi:MULTISPECIES: CRISPR-associated endonuclease Cas3'' [unclassified Meiothermus]|uniref:CRISPR-associated endonuclease Cas3'' n=1 Tax=unclassified Meiothermus TaxID=370471 RepID=UPI000D7CE3C4|nr:MULTISPECIES: CRISPR-associated endonuclease Cas3'' [unclassified Meiothermus]PZA07706.1 CRISPR-associated endonuclease Cas3'' [Meiothermus sp. Pnk-1]RYM34481.1 CRISPR-associated endonuclease Cas3'' [Meiothermus sp. PNK-Is4]